MKADLHVHSTHSGDGKQSVAEIVDRCKELEIAAVAITDHNALAAPDEARTLECHGVIVIPAIEITCSKGHILAIGVKELVPRGLEVKETIERIHAAGGLAAAPHPYRWWSGLGNKNIIGQDFDAIETINGRSLRSSNFRAKKLAERLGLAEIGGSDAHSNTSLGRTYTVVPDTCTTADDIVEAIRNKRTYAEGNSRPLLRSISLGSKSILRWFRRGFKRL